MRPYIRFVALTALILLIGGATLIVPIGSGGSPDAEAQTNDSGKKEALSGTLDVVRGDPRRGSDEDEQHKTRYLLTDNKGKTTELSLDESKTKPLGGPSALDRKRVKVEGTRGAEDQLEVSSVQYEQSADATAAATQEPTSAVSGSRKVVTVLCRFKDSTNVTPHDKPWFETLMGGSYPGEDHYWQDTSYGTINLAGSTVMGWYNLPQPRSYYLSNGNADLTKLADDCAAAADNDVTFPNYSNINFMFNQDLDCCAWGGSRTMNLDGKTKSYRTTWMPPWGYENQAVMSHEMGHSFGLPHSSGSYSKTYDSSWDPMSNTWGSSYCSPGDAQYGCIGADTISYHKDRLGWIPASDKYVATTGSNQNLTIDRLGSSSSGSGYLMAKIPIGGSSTNFYTVEARRFVGYDSQIPAEALVIHKVDTTLEDRNAQVVDSDNNVNPNDSGAMWLPGETFTDAGNGISVKVNRATSSSYDVTVNPDPPNVSSTSPDSAATDVALDADVSAIFSEEMDPETLVTDQTALTSTNVKLYERVKKKIRRHRKVRRVWRWVPVSAEVSYDAPTKTVTLKPYGTSETLLDPYRSHRVVIGTGVKDEAGNALAQNHSWTFTTGSS